MFRGKRLVTEEWFEGNLILGDIIKRYETYIVQVIGKNQHWKTISVDSETVCQYTGLNDKTGKKIFEGDIIKHDMSNTIGVAKWYHGNYTGWYMEDICMGEQQFTNEMWNECEVIGNIFDNPELLEK